MARTEYGASAASLRQRARPRPARAHHGTDRGGAEGALDHQVAVARVAGERGAVHRRQSLQTRATQGIIRLIPWGRHTVVVNSSLLFDRLNGRRKAPSEGSTYNVACKRGGEGGGAAVAWTPPRCTAAAAYSPAACGSGV